MVLTANTAILPLHDICDAFFAVIPTHNLINQSQIRKVGQSVPIVQFPMVRDLSFQNVNLDEAYNAIANCGKVGRMINQSELRKLGHSHRKLTWK